VGVIVGTWHFGETQGDLPGDELSAIATIGRWLQAATGLRVELHSVIGLYSDLRESHTLRIPTIRQQLFDWGFYDRTARIEESAATLEEWEEMFDWGAENRAVTVHGFIPEHPYLWENLDAVMTAAGGRRGTLASIGWQPNPAGARLRTRWDSLSPRDRFVLAMPSLLGARPFDRLL
jgi:hypothetical protein